MTKAVLKRYNRWTLLARVSFKYWVARCDCGTEKQVNISDVRLGKSKSCGCLARELTSVRSKIVNRTHGLEGSTEYRIWVDIRRRCHQPHRPDYKNYGARGIYVCDQWRFGQGDLSGFEVFYRDMGPRPSRSHTLDRVDNNGPYSPQNCRWGTRLQQERNKRSNRLITVRGEQMTVAEAAERYAVPYGRLAGRARMGWDGDRAVFSAITKR